jgi:two-component system NtrC family sensor kinase
MPVTLRLQVVLFAAVAIGLVVGMTALQLGPALVGVAVIATLVLVILVPMARQLSHLKVEAAAAERDARIYHARLEETVRTRTAELEAANVRLAESLQQLKTTQARLLFADRLASVGQLAAGVGHEINNPLAYVLSNLHFIQKEMTRTQGAPELEEREELLTAIADAREGAERVRLIVQDLKQLSRPDDASSGPVDLGGVLRRVMKLASHEIGRRARLVEELGELPPVQGSGAGLGQAFLNLLINAAQAIPEGNAAVNEVRVKARWEAPERVVVEVSDTGRGIAPEHLERIFEPFFTTKPVGEGTGLGLAVCHGIVQSHGGEIQVRSEPGKGATFRVSLKAVAPAAELRASEQAVRA